MEYIKKKISLGDISIGLANSNGYPKDMVKNNIMANVAVGLTMSNNVRKEIEAIYEKDKRRYYEAAKSSTAYEHIIITMGNIEQEIHAKKALGIVVCAEEDQELRNKIIQLIRKHYPEVYQLVKNGDRKLSRQKYTRLKGNIAYKHGRIDGGFIVYLSIYLAWTLKIETGISDVLYSALNDINKFENQDPITDNITEVIEMHKEELKSIKSQIKKEFGSIVTYGGLLSHLNGDIQNLSNEIKNILTLEKLDVEETFSEVDSVNIDNIIIAYIKRGYDKHDIKEIQRLVVVGVFVKLLLKEYRKARSLYFDNNKETLYWELEELNTKVRELTEENITLHQSNSQYKESIDTIDKTIEEEKSKFREEYDKEIFELKREINKLKSQINEGENNKEELYQLREMMFEIKQDYTPEKIEVSLTDLIKNKKIAIIGGTNDWRMKIKDKYSNFITIDGFNEGFDASILNNVNFIFFYTGYMNHGTYYKVINLVRNKEIPFGYIGKTNVDLIEREIADILQKHKI